MNLTHLIAFYWEILSNIVKVIHNLNTIITTKIKAVEYTTGRKCITYICHCLSPFLFNLQMDKIITEIISLNMENGFNNTKTTMICFSNDAAIIAENKYDLLVNIFIAKTKSMTFSIDPIMQTSDRE